MVWAKSKNSNALTRVRAPSNKTPATRSVSRDRSSSNQPVIKAVKAAARPSTSPRPRLRPTPAATPSVRVSSRSSTPAARASSSTSRTPTFKNLTQAARAGYHGQTVNIAGKGRQKVAFSDKSYDSKMARASATAAPSTVSARGSAERRAEVEAARAAGAANPRSYVANKNLVTANPANVGNPAFSQPAPGTDLSNPNRTYFGQPKPPGYKEGTYINFTDMIDGGGPGAYGDKFSGGISGISNASGATPFGSGIAATGIAGVIDRGIQRNTNYTGGFSDLIDGGGPGTSGPVFGGALGPLSNKLLPGPAGAAGGTMTNPTPVAPVPTPVTPTVDISTQAPTSVAPTSPSPTPVTPPPVTVPDYSPITSGMGMMYDPITGLPLYQYSGQFAFNYPGFGPGAGYVGGNQGPLPALPVSSLFGAVPQGAPVPQEAPAESPSSMGVASLAPVINPSSGLV